MARSHDEVSRRHSVRITGPTSAPVLMFAHGFGGSSASWRYVAPAFEADHRVVVFDYVGAPGTDRADYDRIKYDSLYGYADDVIELIEQLDLAPVVFVGHSVSAMVGVLAANARPELFSALIMLGPSARYIDSDTYQGGFSQDAIEDLLTSLDSNFVSWSDAIAGALVGSAPGSGRTDGLGAEIRRIDPDVAAQFARVTFLSDTRRDLAEVSVPTLVLQSVEDDIAAPGVGRYVHEHIPGSRMVVTRARGHVPHLSDPDEVVQQIRAYLA